MQRAMSLRAETRFTHHPGWNEQMQEVCCPGSNGALSRKTHSRLQWKTSSQSCNWRILHNAPHTPPSRRYLPPLLPKSRSRHGYSRQNHRSA